MGFPFNPKREFLDEKGQALVEYALILLLVAVVLAFVLPGITAALATSYNEVAAAF